MRSSASQISAPGKKQILHTFFLMHTTQACWSRQKSCVFSRCGFDQLFRRNTAAGTFSYYFEADCRENAGIYFSWWNQAKSRVPRWLIPLMSQETLDRKEEAKQGTACRGRGSNWVEQDILLLQVSALHWALQRILGNTSQIAHGYFIDACRQQICWFSQASSVVVVVIQTEGFFSVLPCVCRLAKKEGPCTFFVAKLTTTL